MHDDEIICPITRETPRVPVVTNNNYIYEFSAIATSILQNPIEPLDRRSISSLRFLSSLEGQFLPIEEEINIIRLLNQLYLRKIAVFDAIKGISVKLLSHAIRSDDNKISCILLIGAIIRNDTRTIRILLTDLRIDLNASVDDVTPLLCAIYCGNVNIVRILLRYSTIDVNHSVMYRTPLLLAIENDEQDIVSLLSHHEKLLALPNWDPSLTPFLIAIEQANISRIDEILGDFSLPNISNLFFTRIREKDRELISLYQKKLKLLLNKQSDPALRAALQKLCDENRMCDIRHNIYLALALHNTCTLLSEPTAQKCEDYKAFIAIMKSKQLGWCPILIEVLKIVSTVLIVALGGWTFPASLCVVPLAGRLEN